MGNWAFSPAQRTRESIEGIEPADDHTALQCLFASNKNFSPPVTFPLPNPTIWVKYKERKCYSLEDAEIIELFLVRDEDAIQETERAYGRKLNTLAWRILHSREDAEESVSDTYLETWKSIPPYHPKYFFAFLESLPKDSRLIFLRRYWYLDTIAEIAQRYGMTESKVKMQLSRTKEKLRVFLEKEDIRV